jgi:hypothetical protein
MPVPLCWHVWIASCHNRRIGDRLKHNSAWVISTQQSGGATNFVCTVTTHGAHFYVYWCCSYLQLQYHRNWTLQGSLVSLLTTGFNIKKFYMMLALRWAFCTDLRTGTVALFIINWFVFITVVESVYSAVRLSPYVKQIKFSLEKVNIHVGKTQGIVCVNRRRGGGGGLKERVKHTLLRLWVTSGKAH